MAYSLDDWKSGQPLPKGFDVADALAYGWTREQVTAFMVATAREWSPQPDPPPPPPKPEPEPSKPVTQMRTFEQAEPAEVVSIKTRKSVTSETLWQTELLTNDEGKIKPGAAHNWALYLTNHSQMKGVFAFDSFKQTITLAQRPPWESGKDKWAARVLKDSDYQWCVNWLETHYMTPKVSTIAPVIQAVAEQNSFDRLTDYLESLEWDGQPRIENWLTYYLGCADNSYSKIIGPRYLISAVARGLDAGCKVDTMLILEGPQGKRKSEVLRELFGPGFFTDELSDIGSKDAMMEMQGVWCIEVAEMHALNKADTNHVKKFLTKRTDRFRPPYGRSVIEVPRRVVLAGTTNPDGSAYFKDTTGGRRFWPVLVGDSIDLEAIRADRDQIWAEAVHHWRAGQQWWVQEEELSVVTAEQEKRTEVDPWMDTVADATHGKATILQRDALKATGVLEKDMTPFHVARIGRIMQKLGFRMEREKRGGADVVLYARNIQQEREDENAW